jgi:ATP/maltotriose-dependent transcriptional regulator MalT
MPTRDDPEAMHLLGAAALLVGAFDLAAGFLAASAEGLRAQGRLGHLARVLFLWATAAVHLADLDAAIPTADEARRLALETGEPLWAAGALAVQAMLAALHGEFEVAEALAAEAERLSRPIGASFVLAAIQLARGLAALGNGRHEEAYGHLRRVFDPTDPAAIHSVRFQAIRDLAEAAVHSGYRAEARELLAELELLGEQTPSPSLHVSLRLARPLLAEDADAEALFLAGLDADLHRWPFDRARLQLAYGTWLRRQRRIAESRAPLRAARQTFDALGLIPWGERARQELRASGERSHRQAPEARDQLTPQELQIAQMAAAGLSNREIGQRLYLSHRTVGSHLYRIFPKLGITARSGLRDALSGKVPALT